MSLNISLIKQVISQLELGTSQRATASALSISKSVVGKLALRIQNSISGTPVVVKHFRIKFFFSLAKQDLFPYFFWLSSSSIYKYVIN